MSNDLNLSPSEIARLTSEYLENLKRQYLDAVDEITYAIPIAASAIPYYTNADPNLLQASGLGGTAIMVQRSFYDLVVSANQNAQEQLRFTSAIGSAASVYGHATNAAHNNVLPVLEYKPENMIATVDQWSRYQQYADKFARFDAELGRLYKQIIEVMGRTTSYPEKSLQSELRQAFDCLMNRLAPVSEDTNIRSQQWFVEFGVHGTDPNKISTQQRVRYAAEKHVSNVQLRQNIISNSLPMYRTYQALSENFHKTSSINVWKAREIYLTMLDFLNLWADALNI